MTNMSIQPLWLTHFIEILLVIEFKLTKFIVGTFSYKAHFRPQISSIGMMQIKMKIEKQKNHQNLQIHAKRKILIRGDLHGYERLSKVQKDMGLQKKCTKRGKEPGPAPAMQHYCVTSLIKNLPTMKKQKRRKNGRML